MNGRLVVFAVMMLVGFWSGRAKGLDLLKNA
jgi:hypothetical protein